MFPHLFLPMLKAFLPTKVHIEQQVCNRCFCLMGNICDQGLDFLFSYPVVTNSIYRFDIVLCPQFITQVLNGNRKRIFVYIFCTIGPNEVDRSSRLITCSRFWTSKCNSFSTILQSSILVSPMEKTILSKSKQR